MWVSLVWGSFLFKSCTTYCVLIFPASDTSEGFLVLIGVGVDGVMVMTVLTELSSDFCLWKIVSQTETIIIPEKNSKLCRKENCTTLWYLNFELGGSGFSFQVQILNLEVVVFPSKFNILNLEVVVFPLNYYLNLTIFL